MKISRIQLLSTIVCLWLMTPMIVLAETEPNDAYGTANPLAPNGSSNGTLSRNSTPSDIYDWWKVTTSFDGSLVVNTTSDPSLDIDLYLYDQDGTTQIASYDTSVGIHEATHWYSLKPGTYYVLAFCYSGAGSYTISNVYTPTGLANDNEINDSSSVASLFSPNSSTTGHLGYYGAKNTDMLDWWKVTTTFDGALVVNTTSDRTLDIDLRIFDQDGKTQIAGYDTSVGIHEATHCYNLTPGTYYVQAYRYGGYGSYTISNVYTPTGLSNDSSPNDSVKTASALPVNGSTTGHLGYFNRGVEDIYDWWKVTATFDGALVVNITSDKTLDIDLRLFDQDGTTQIASYDTSVGIHEATHFHNLKSGTYYIQAYRYGGYGSYTISNVFTPTRLADDTEPNDSLSTARSISLNSASTGHLGFFGNGKNDQYDFYTFTLPNVWDTLFIRTDSDPTLDIDIALYNQSGSQIYSSGASGPMELLVRSQTSAGTYSIRLSGYGGGYGSYTIIVSNARPGAPSVGVQEEEIFSSIPKIFSLSQNYPNPFNPTTSFEFQIPRSEFVSIKVFDLLGREVTLLVNEERPAGVYKVSWDASTLPSGVYIYQVQTGCNVSAKKAILLK